MRLLLELLDGSDRVVRRELDGQFVFSIGTRPGCDWMLPRRSDGQDGALTIEPASNGFMIKAQRDCTVTLNGHRLTPETPNLIHDGSELQVADRTLVAKLLTQPFQNDRDAKHDVTISSILGMPKATSGPLPSTQSSAPWPDPGAEQAQLSRSAKPLQSEAGRGPVLPLDWDEEPGTAPDLSEQHSSVSTQVRIGPATPHAPAPKPVQNDRGLASFLSGAELPDQFGVESPEQTLKLAGRALRAAVESINLLSDQLARQSENLGGQSDLVSVVPPARTLDAVLSSTQPDELLHTQIEAVIGQIEALHAGTHEWVKALQDELDPDQIEARAGSGLSSRAGRAWRLYRKVWDGQDNAPPPVSTARLDREIRWQAEPKNGSALREDR